MVINVRRNILLYWFCSMKLNNWLKSFLPVNDFKSTMKRSLHFEISVFYEENVSTSICAWSIIATHTVNICLRPTSHICECPPLNDVTFEHLLNRLLEFLCGGPPQIGWADGGRRLQLRTWQTSVDVFCSCHLFLSPAWDLMVPSLMSHIFISLTNIYSCLKSLNPHASV
jgi:hypothetical protein